MDQRAFINALFLCLLNVIFMIAGIFLNSVVIISLRRSSQLRKKLCYFLILPLSCFDLAVVAIGHPILIFRTILWYMDKHEEESKLMKSIIVIVSNLNGFSMSALLTLSAERFLALKYPFFHQTAVTKRRLVLFLAFFVVVTVSLLSLRFFDGNIIDNAALIVYILLFLLLFMYLNYNMLLIAKSKRKGQSISITHGHEEAKRRIVNFKETSTCLMAVGCFFICSFLVLVSSVWQLIEDTLSNDRSRQIFCIWSCTVFLMNSTFNCLIFFWRNSILRREGIKTVKCFRSARP